MSRRGRGHEAALALTERSLSDLREIERYSRAEWGDKVADRYFDEIAAALDRISENPGLLAEEPGFASGLYFYRVRKHVLVCDCRDRSIVVLTVLHTSMDLPSRLSDLEPRLIAEAEILHEKLRG